MEFTATYKDRVDAIVDLFAKTFATSEGEAEGRLIGALVTDMLESVPDEDLLVALALEGDAVVGGVLFSRMQYPEDDRTIFVLSPAAVATEIQGTGVGQRLIRFGLEQLRGRGVDVVLTYGDINFYSKVGFALISEDVAKAPLPLSYPEGWLGQSLTGEALAPLTGPSHCVPALNKPEYW